jgi:integrase/recombinase XerC
MAMNLPALANTHDPQRLPDLGDADLLAAFLATLSQNTQAAYTADIADFTKHLDLDSPRHAIGKLLGFGPAQANRLMLEYLAALTERKLKSATIARRLASLRSLVRMGRSLGRINWTVEVRGPKITPYRDTRGPGRDGWCKMRDAAALRNDPKGLRDLALVRLLHDLGLRRSEAITLDLAHVEIGATHAEDPTPIPFAIHALGKGKRDRDRIELPHETAAALQAWLQIRGNDAGPVFHRLDHPDRGGRLTGRAVGQIVAKLGGAAGLTRGTHPHGLRHTAITEALDLTGGDVRRVQRFSRHARIETLLLYDDARTNPSIDVARAVAAD